MDPYRCLSAVLTQRQTPVVSPHVSEISGTTEEQFTVLNHLVIMESLMPQRR